MQNATLTGIAIALGSGLAVGVQSTLFTVIGRAIGPVRASVVLNVVAGLIGGAVLLGALAIQGREQWVVSRPTLLHVLIATTLGMFIVAGVAFAFQKTGVAAGIATVFLGQMVIATAVDALGWAGGQPIPVDLNRVLGLVALAVGVTLLVYRH